MIILKVTKTKGFTLSLEDIILVKMNPPIPQGLLNLLRFKEVIAVTSN